LIYKDFVEGCLFPEYCFLHSGFTGLASSSDSNSKLEQYHRSGTTFFKLP